MANEISGSFQIQVTNGGYNDGRVYQFTADQSAVALGARVVQTIPTTAGGTALSIPATIATLGYAWFINLDPTNYIQIGVKPAGTFVPVIRLKGNATVSKREGALMRLEPGVALFALANTASVNLEIGVFND